MTMRTRMARPFCALALAAAIGGPALSQDVAANEEAERPADRVLGGDAVSIADYPWQVALVRDRSDFFEGQFCGGSVISETWILTAAHCVYDKETGKLKTPDSMAIYWGSASLLGGGQLADIRQIVPHADYTGAHSGYDIALIELLRPIAATPVRLANAETAPFLEAASVRAFVTGWGEFKPDFTAEAEAAGLTDAGVGAPSRYPTELQGVEVPVVDRPTCAAGLYATLDEGVVCAGKPLAGVDACNGDSGGPLHVRDADGRWAQIGIVSWGSACSAGGDYNVYTRVSAYRDWMADAIAGVAAIAHPLPADIMGTVPGRIPIRLAAGFASHAEAVDAGGVDPASDRSAGCAGFIAGKPDFSLHFEAGGAPLSISAAAPTPTDTTLFVIAPDGKVLCNDDSEGLNPAVTLDAAPSGEYRIWVGTIAPVVDDGDPSTSDFPAATLYVSENGPRFAG